MKTNFLACLAFTLQYEGGYVNNPHDPGGPTNMGVTIVTLSHELGRAATIGEVRNMSRDMAANIYRKKYWNMIGGDALPAGVDLMEFDICVNSGIGRVAPWARDVRAMSVQDQIMALHARRMGFWKGLRIWSTFGLGWTRRETACLALAIKMAGASA